MKKGKTVVFLGVRMEAPVMKVQESAAVLIPTMAHSVVSPTVQKTKCQVAAPMAQAVQLQPTFSHGCNDDMECGSASLCDLEISLDSEGGVCMPVHSADCHELGCSQRGFCSAAGHCECPFPFTGPQCEYIVEEP